MKNLKGMLTGIGMAAVLAVGATSANAGMLLSDRSVTDNQKTCSVKSSSIIQEIAGIIIIGLNPGGNGMFLSDAPCTETQLDGMLLSD